MTFRRYRRNHCAKRRFDEIFFVDLPDSESHAEVFRIHLGKRELRPEDFDVAVLVQATDGFSGAEIEQLVVAALYWAAVEDTVLDTRHLLDEARATRPLSVIMADRVAALRAWARGAG